MAPELHHTRILEIYSHWRASWVAATLQLAWDSCVSVVRLVLSRASFLGPAKHADWSKVEWSKDSCGRWWLVIHTGAEEGMKCMRGGWHKRQATTSG
eukprot:INCI9885.1.p1 GENE.INCI9885.1~~INCI9885.1.p1  ORF type:complete len:104 (+),score=6.47 INCI9885.1:23-313(+)